MSIRQKPLVFLCYFNELPSFSSVDFALECQQSHSCLLCLLKILSGLYVLLQVKMALWRHLRRQSNIPSIFAQTVKLHPDKPALVYEATGETWTFTQLDQLSNSVGQWALAQGWVSGDVVALFMESRPLQVALWLGLAKVGVEAALINFNLRLDSLVHCIGVSASRGIVFGAELADGKWGGGLAMKEGV